ncbi:Arm DNA-binding domain-containing protein [Martelella sp. AD-3]|uniref:Arm DNA-binding domain-containing protein n=1 Tax=Martelella sp. AD-3 TaxID=686597 RepID=UPI0004679C2B|nr:Arm DNA-binding domain-containing protein [Martelella sp. AD-3]AMM84631.1 hypothetical protein AZF01_09920 [Martelella sp. AD-3]
MPNIYLTDTFVRTVRCPADKDQIIYWDNPVSPDGKVRHGAVGGLGLRVTARGNKSFVHAYAFNGERRRKALGAAGVLNVGSARLAVLERERKLGEGSDPDTDERELTVRDAIDRYWSTHIC